MTQRIRASSAFGALTIGLLVAACGSSTATGSPSSSGATSSDSSGPTPTLAPPTPQPSVAVAPFDLSATIDGLAKLDSYRETITVGGRTAYDTIVVTKPTTARSTKIAGGATIVVVGDKAWMSNDDGKTFKPIPNSMIGPLTAGFGPELISGPFNGTVFAQGATDKGAEKKNGVDAHRFHIDSTTPGGSFSSFPPGATVDVWVADDGYLVAVETKGFTGTQDIQIQVTNVNDPANKVEAPA